MNALDELRAALCGVGIVGKIDGHDVIRRDSVIELLDRRRAQPAPAQGERQPYAWHVEISAEGELIRDELQRTEPNMNHINSLKANRYEVAIKPLYE